MSFRKSFVNSLRSVSSRVVVPKGASQRLKDLTSSVKGTLERSGVSQNLKMISDQMKLIKQKTEVIKELMGMKGFVAPDPKGRIHTERRKLHLPNAANPIRDVLTESRAREIVSSLQEQNDKSETFMTRLKRKAHVFRVKTCNTLQFVAPDSQKIFAHTNYFNEPKRCETKVFKNRTDIKLDAIKPLENVDDEFYREIRAAQLQYDDETEVEKREQEREYFCEHKCGFSGSYDAVLAHERECTFKERKKMKKFRKEK